MITVKNRDLISSGFIKNWGATTPDLLLDLYASSGAAQKYD